MEDMKVSMEEFEKHLEKARGNLPEYELYFNDAFAVALGATKMRYEAKIIEIDDYFLTFERIYFQYLHFRLTQENKNSLEIELIMEIGKREMRRHFQNVNEY